MRVWLWFVAVVLTLAGCAKKSEAVYAEEIYYDEAEAAAAPAAFGGGVRMKKEAANRSRRPSRAPSTISAVTGGSPPTADAPIAPEDPAPERMIAYEGSTTLRVARVRPAVDAITTKVEALGGFVERVDGRRMVVRVPVARFREGLAEVQTVGDIVSERIFASDVTEAFQDVKLRLDTMEATRARLVELLALTQDENEKLMLIREIQRLTDQIDQATAQATTLRRMADLSRIVVDLVEREALAHQGSASDSAAFAWIRQLSPFGSDVVRSGKHLKLDVPDGMVGLDLKREFVAEAPDGSRIWSGKLDTEVDTDGGFWIAAVKERLAGDFATAEVSSMGSFAVLTLTSRTDTPYTWIIAVRPDGKRLEVVEAYLSSPKETERFLPAIRAVVAAHGGAA